MDISSAVLVIRPARPDDTAPAEALLTETGLPLDGFREHLGAALVADRGGALVGVVELELYDPENEGKGAALLRSLAVAPGERGRRTGERLAAEAMDLAAKRGVRDVYLLTETAVEFFPRFGFAVENRAHVPAAVRSSAEFTGACPESAILMHARVGRVPA